MKVRIFENFSSDRLEDEIDRFGTEYEIVQISYSYSDETKMHRCAVLYK